VVFDDSSTNILITPQHINNGIKFSDSSYGSVYYHTPLESADTAKFSNTVDFIISRTKEVLFKNVMLAGVGITPLDLYEVPALYLTELLNISLTYISTAVPPPTVEISIDIIKYSTGETISIIKDIPLEKGETFIINNKEMGVSSVNEKDKIVIYADHTSAIDVYMAIAEIKN
jgi:hypothetical protein